MNKLVEESRPPDTFTGGWEGPGDKINHVTLTRNHDDIYIFSLSKKSVGKRCWKRPNKQMEVDLTFHGHLVD